MTVGLFLQLRWEPFFVNYSIAISSTPTHNRARLFSDATCCTRPQFLGDCLGLRSYAQQNCGITYRGRITQFFFGVEGGINVPLPPGLPLGQGDTFDYTGTARHDFLVDMERYGGCKASKLIVTLDQIWGRYGNVSFSSGAIAPIFNAFIPVDFDAQAVPRVTNFFYLQPLSEGLILGVGKKRLPDIADQDIFAGGDGSDGFLNQKMLANPHLLAVVPVTSFAVTAVMPRKWGGLAVTVIDPLDRSTEFMEFGSLYSTGMILISEIKAKTNFFCKPGEHHVGGIWKSVDLPDLRFFPQPPTYPYPPAPPGIPSISDTYVLYYGFDQYVSVFW